MVVEKRAFVKRGTYKKSFLLFIFPFDLDIIIVIINTMDGFSVGKILAGLRNPELYLKKLKQENTILGGNNFNQSLAQPKPPAAPNLQPQINVMQQLQMNQIAAMDRSIYIKNLLMLPQTMGAILQAVQDKTKPLNTNTLLLNDINQELLKNQKIIAQLFDDTSEIPLNTAAQNMQTQIAAAQKDAVMLFFSGMVHLPALQELILKNSKQAAANLIIAMASASKSGMTSDQIRETLSIINSCVSMAESGNPNQTIKSLMMLYIPWLPLNEGVGFDLEIEPPDGENDSNDSKLTVLIQTKNFGNVKGVFILTTSNSVDIYILCSDEFPKKMLEKSLKEESSTLAVHTNIDVEAVTPIKKETFEKAEAKVNLSATNEMNPYLLLMAHAFIRNTIFIDSNAISEQLAADEPNS